MKKSAWTLTVLLTLTTLLALSSLAFFTSQTESSFITIATGSLSLDMDLNDAPEDGISGLAGGEQPWIPGDHREALVTIKNTGSLPARWRMGFVTEGSPDLALVDNIIVSWYVRHGDGWQLIDSQRMLNLLITDNQENWLYDQALYPAGGFEPLSPGSDEELVLQIDFELNAERLLQNKEFQGELILQGTQVLDEGWLAVDSIPVTLRGPSYQGAEMDTMLHLD